MRTPSKSRRPSSLSRFLDSLEPRLLLSGISFAAGRELGITPASFYAFADINTDGKLDYIGNSSDNPGAAVTVAHGIGNASFNDPVSINNVTGWLRAVADFNNDGKPDLLTAEFAGSVLDLYLNTGNGVFALPQYLASGSTPTLAAVGDLNNDNFPDLVVFNSGDNTFSVYLNNGSGSLLAPTVSPAFVNPTNALAIGDFDGDGFGDLATNSVVAKGNGNGTFQAAVHVDIPANAILKVADFNNDGKDDLLAADTTSPQIHFLNGSLAGLTAKKVYTTINGSITGLAVGDFNGDGKIDFAAADAGNITFFANAGNLNFNQAAPFAHSGNANQGLLSADVNNDTKPDLITYDGNAGFLNLILGKGDGTFLVPIPYIPASTAGRIVAGDFNGDGRADLLSTNYFTSIDTRTASLASTFSAPAALVSADADVDPTYAALGDLNGDGKLDIAEVEWADDTLHIFLGSGNGSFFPVNELQGPYDVNYVTIADLNHDNKPDIIVGGDDETYVYMNPGNALFGQAYSIPSPIGGLTSMAVGDFNNDGQVDLAVPNPNNSSISIYQGKGDGSFPTRVDFNVGVSVSQVVAGDFNKDGRTDLAALSGNSVYLILANQNGSLSLRSITGVGPSPTVFAVGDFNADGFLDLAALNTDYYNAAYDGNITVLRGNGDGTFRDLATFVAGIGATTLTTGDVNFDGKLDLITNTNVILNNSAPTPTSLTLTSSVPTSNYGDSVTFTATIFASALTATGNIQFYSDGFAIGAPVPLVNGIATLATSATNAGTHTIRATMIANTDFASSTNTAPISVAKANLNVTVNPAARQYGQANPLFTGSFTGLLNNDPITLLFKTTANAASHPGDYAITPTFQDSKNKLKNYIVITAPANLTIIKADPTILWPAPLDIFGGNPLTTKQLNAKLLKPGGALTYDQPLGTILPVGVYTLTVTAAATADYNQASASVELHVNLPGPNLQVALGALAPNYTSFVPGETIKIPVTLTNIGNQTANASVALPISLALRLGDSTDYNPADPLLAPVMLITTPLKANAKKAFNVTYKIPLDFDPATFFVTSNVDSPDAASDPNPDNNTAASPSLNVSNSFGILPGRKPAAILTYVDTDGTLVKFTLAGGGTAALAINGTDVDVTISGATAKSSLTITVTKSKTPGDDGLFTLHNLTINSPFANIAALTTTLAGDLTIGGSAAAVSFLNIDGGVATSALTITGALKSLTSKNNLAHTTLTALSVGTLTVTNNITNTSIHLSQPVDPKLKALTTLTAKQFVNSEIRSAGNLGNITLTLIDSSRIFAGVLDSVTGLPLSAGDFVSLVPADLPTIANFTLKVAAKVATPIFTDSFIAAGQLKVVKLPTLATTLANPAALPFGFTSRLAPTTYTGVASTGNFFSSKDHIV